ncbi:hypothetical protein E2C01_092949 [Portunus trituberculatus]|uniref:Uncharacterized protein n=1 Tax=Portunus trituberculatus TaxID=210409 RepID=A0A5B7JSS6_PORTR|nr:hypothetical protein [Portunus trituberculatus]
MESQTKLRTTRDLPLLHEEPAEGSVKYWPIRTVNALVRCQGEERSACCCLVTTTGTVSRGTLQVSSPYSETLCSLTTTIFKGHRIGRSGSQDYFAY